MGHGQDYYEAQGEEFSRARREIEEEKLSNILNLLDQIIEQVAHEDGQSKKTAIAEHRGSQAVGESWMLFHLKILREIIEKNGDV
jgi:hypothetical protein